MIANYRCGRQADALRTYQRARETLIDELGIEPSPELRALELAVLAQDTSLDAPAPSRTTTSDMEGPSSTGTITVLLTDIEESSALWERAPDAMAAVQDSCPFARLDILRLLFVGRLRRSAIPTPVDAKVIVPRVRASWAGRCVRHCSSGVPESQR